MLAERFVLVGELGRGATAVVWLADDRLEGRRVALKLLHAHLADEVGAIRRLRRELEVARRIDHPAALVAWGLHEVEDGLALSMPVHDGASLAEAVRVNGPWTADALLRMGRRLADALAAAHAAGVLHRDVSPANVLVGRDGEVVLSDFGLARIGGRATRTIAATPGYAAPEVLEGRAPDPRSDLYGLGAVLYFAATGQGPFDAGSPAAVLRRQLDGGHVPLVQARPELPASLTRAVDAMLAVEPAARPGAAREVAAWLERGPTEAAPAAVAPWLPAGAWCVVVTERATDRGRRRRERWRHRRRRRGGLLAVVERRLARLGRVVRRTLAWPPSVPPERALAAEVAAVAGLPPDALDVPRAMWRARFALVVGVDEPTAERLRARAVALGFGAAALHGPPAGVRRGAMLGGTTALAASGALVAEPAWAPLLVVSAVAAGLAALRLGAPPPAAFAADLTPRLRAPYRERVASRPRGEHPARAPVDPVDEARAHLDALQVAVDGVEELPAPAVADLCASVAGMRAELDAAASALAALGGEALAARAEAAERAVEQVQARIRRMETLRRAGVPADERELVSLRATVDRHLAVLRAADEDEALRVRMVARILDLGSVAQQARRELGACGGPGPAEAATRARRALRDGLAARAEVGRG